MGNVQILLRQHVGAPCAPCVEVGADVKKGTLIAAPTGLGANIFSSVYGKVTEITDDRIIIEPAAEQPDEFVPIDVPLSWILRSIRNFRQTLSWSTAISW